MTDFLSLGRVANDAVKAGDRLIADGGFPCIADGAVVTVEEDADGLFVRCSGPDDDHDPNGRHHHYLVGQYGEDGFLVGMRRAPEERL